MRVFLRLDLIFFHPVKFLLILEESNFRRTVIRRGKKALKANGLDWPRIKREAEKFNSQRT